MTMTLHVLRLADHVSCPETLDWTGLITRIDRDNGDITIIADVAVPVAERNRWIADNLTDEEYTRWLDEVPAVAS